MKIILYISVLLSSIMCSAQDFKKCTVYQFSGTDSTKKHTASIQIFNNRGQIISETYSNFKKSVVEGTVDGTHYYNYKDSLLTARLFIDNNQDTSKCLYFYNTINQCIRQEHFRCERRVRKDVKKGLGQPGGCVVFKEDFDTNRTWMKTNEITFLYDEYGRLIRKDDEQNYDHTWEYDTLNRITQEREYSSGRLAYVKDYQYFAGGYKDSTIYYDYNGNPKLPEYSDIIFSPTYISTFYLNNLGKIIRQVVTTEKGIEICEELIYYNDKGLYIKTLHRYTGKHFVRNGEPSEIIHIYEYE